MCIYKQGGTDLRLSGFSSAYCDRMAENHGKSSPINCEAMVLLIKN